MVLPCMSLTVTIVLLNDAFTCTTPVLMFLRSRFLMRAAESSFLSAVGADDCACGLAITSFDYFLVAIFLPAIGLALPLRVRALVWVRWPRTGRRLRWRRPR